MCFPQWIHIHACSVYKCILPKRKHGSNLRHWKILIWLMITLLPRCCQSVCAAHFSLPPSLPPSSSCLLFPEPLTDLTKPLHSHQPDPVTCMPPICWRRPGYKLPSEAAARWGRVSQQQCVMNQKKKKKKASPCSCGRRRDLACADYLLDGNYISVCCVVHVKTTELIRAFWNFYLSFCSVLSDWICVTHPLVSFEANRWLAW